MNNRFVCNFLWVISLFIFSLIGVARLPASAAVENSIKIGVALRFEEAAQEGFINSFMNGFDLAKKEYQQAHPGSKIEFVKYAHQTAPDSIKVAAKKIVNDHIQFVLGGESSDEVKVMSEILEPAKVLMMSPTSSDPEVTAGKTYIYRACFADDRVAQSLAKYVSGQLKSSKAPAALGIVHNTGNSYTHFITKAFTTEIVRHLQEKTKLSFPIIGQKYSGENYSFDAMVKTFVEEKVNNIVLFTGKNDFLSFVETAQKHKFFPTYYGSDGWGTSQSIVENLGKRNLLKDFVGIHNSYWEEESSRPEVKKFKKDYSAKFSRSPDAWAAIAYDSAKILFTAIDSDGGITKATPGGVAKKLKSSEFIGLVTTPRLKYDLGNSPKKTLYLYEISANRPEFKAALE